MPRTTALRERPGVLMAELDEPSATPSRAAQERTAAIAGGGAGRGCSYSFLPGYAKSAKSAWVAGPPRQQAKKSPRQSPRGAARSVGVNRPEPVHHQVAGGSV
jgi:hypothetical protein